MISKFGQISLEIESINKISFLQRNMMIMWDTMTEFFSVNIYM